MTKKAPHKNTNVAKKALHGKKEQKRLLNCEKNVAKFPPHGEKGSRKAFNNEKDPPPHPHGGINIATRPPFYSTVFIRQQMLYISWIFVLASHSTNIFLLFIPHRTNWPIFAFLFSFSRGGQSPLPPWTSACPPTPFHFAYIVYRSPPLISLVKHK